MERLTEKTVGCFEYSLKDHKAVPGEFGTYDAFFDYSMAVKRLGHYEDTGLDPEEIKGFAEDVAYQFGYYFPIKDMLYISTGGFSTLEWAFRILGWNDPHPVPECECEFPGCHEHATCGTPTKDGYKRVCGKHFAELYRDEAEAAMAQKGGEG